MRRAEEQAQARAVHPQPRGGFDEQRGREAKEQQLALPAARRELDRLIRIGEQARARRKIRDLRIEKVKEQEIRLRRQAGGAPRESPVFD
jgi:hypothetical protein